MALVLHNTLTRSREPFEPANPADPKLVTMYVCGPTVYNYAHIGNVRPPVVFDVLQRLLRRTYTLTYARNVTDVDDKINDAVKREGVPIGVLTARYLAAYHEDLRMLGVAPPDVEPRVTEHIPGIIGFIERLIAAGHAYAAEDHVLFAVPSFADYGRLSGRDPEDMLAGARVEVAPYKRDPGDFVLWKPSAADIVGWPSPWGRGRPGWHIECSAMAEAHLGETIDIHGGGVDLLFPHHENELAQSTCAHGGKPFARYWLHNGLMQFDGEKMSKSLGNVQLARDLVAEHGGETVRFALARRALSSASRLDRAARRRDAAEARPHVRRAARGRHLRRADAPAGGRAARGRARRARGRPEHAGGARGAVRRRARRESRHRSGREARARGVAASRRVATGAADAGSAELGPDRRPATTPRLTAW